MKKLEKLKLHNLEEICVEEQKTLRGGGDDGILPGMIGEVVVYGTAPQNYYNPGATSYGGSVFDGADGFSSPGGFLANYIFGSDQGPDQIWDAFRGWTGSDFPYDSGTQSAGGATSGVFNNCNISAEGIEFMKSWEKGPGGVVAPALMPYDDNGDLPGGKMTIGWGHLIKTGEDFSAGITAAQADSMYLADLQDAVNDVNNSVHVSLTQNQFDALVSYSYNIGGLRKSPNCIVKLNNGDYAGAASEMDIVTAGGQTYPGLVTRRADERTIFNDGIYYCHN